MDREVGAVGVRLSPGSWPLDRLGLAESSPNLHDAGFAARSDRWTIEGRCLCGETIRVSFFVQKATISGWVTTGLDIAIEAHLLHCPEAAKVRERRASQAMVMPGQGLPTRR